MRLGKSLALLMPGALLVAASASCGRKQTSNAPSALDKRVEVNRAGPLDRLAEVGEHLNKGGAEFLNGSDRPKAFQPWAASPDAPRGSMDPLRDELKAAGVASLANLGFELELIFLSGGSSTYYLRTFVHTGEDGVSFLNFEGRSETAGPAGEKIENLSGLTEPFREAAQSLLEKIKRGDCTKLPFTESSTISRLITSESPRAEIIRRTEKAKADLGSTCAALASLKYDEVRLRVDDQAFVALGSDGSTKGTLRGEFEVQGNVLAYALGSFRRF